MKVGRAKPDTGLFVQILSYNTKAPLPFESFEESAVWKKARKGEKSNIERTKPFADSEKFRLNDQIILSSRSMDSQIAKGHVRKSKPEKKDFALMPAGQFQQP